MRTIKHHLPVWKCRVYKDFDLKVIWQNAHYYAINSTVQKHILNSLGSRYATKLPEKDNMLRTKYSSLFNKLFIKRINNKTNLFLLPFFLKPPPVAFLVNCMIFSRYKFAFPEMEKNES